MSQNVAKIKLKYLMNLKNQPYVGKHDKKLIYLQKTLYIISDMFAANSGEIPTIWENICRHRKGRYALDKAAIILYFPFIYLNSHCISGRTVFSI